MRAAARTWKMRGLAVATLVTLSGCTVSGEGYVGGYYDPPGYEYGGWQPGYYVAPPHARRQRDGHDGHDGHGGQPGGDHRAEAPRPPRPPAPRAYRAAPPAPAPSIPTKPAPRADHDRGHRK
jgi:hypothetical protein